MTRQSGYAESRWPERLIFFMDPRPVTSGKFDEAYKEVDRVFEVIGDREKACLGIGCLSYETDPQAVLKVAEYISRK